MKTSKKCRKYLKFLKKKIQTDFSDEQILLIFRRIETLLFIEKSERPISASDLSKYLHISMSGTYRRLRSLSSADLINESIEGRKKYYTNRVPNKILKLIDKNSICEKCGNRVPKHGALLSINIHRNTNLYCDIKCLRN